MNIKIILVLIVLFYIPIYKIWGSIEKSVDRIENRIENNRYSDVLYK